MRLLIAARKSDLARLQAYQVGTALLEKNPNLEISYHFRESLGDREQSNPLWRMPEKGVFTEDFLAGLVSGEFDLVVHSWKDLPTEPRERTEVVATLPRADARDVLLVRREVLKRNSGPWRVLSSSPRRAHFLGEAWKDLAPAGSPALEFHAVRGNIPTRLLKLQAGEGEALLVAKAALDRLLGTSESEFAEAREKIRDVLAGCEWMVLPIRVQPPAPAQGALAIEIAREREDLRELLGSIHCPRTFDAVVWERRQLSTFGGGCHLKLGAYAGHRAGLDLRVLRGQPPQGAAVSREWIERPAAKTRPGATCVLKSEDLFAPDTLVSEIEAEALYAAHSRALPERARFSYLWTAGLQSWKALAARGLWVNGCDESWGEERPGVDHLAGRRLQWTKLTHEEGETSALPVTPTYRLRPREDVDPAIERRVREAGAFYWRSGSLFRRALELWPAIRGASHSCGPGSTRTALERALGPIGPDRIFLDEAEWRMFYGSPDEITGSF